MSLRQRSPGAISGQQGRRSLHTSGSEGRLWGWGRDFQGLGLELVMGHLGGGGTELARRVSDHL